MKIRPIASVEELTPVYEFVRNGLGLGTDHSRGPEFYEKVFRDTSRLLLVAEAGGQLCGALLASVEGDHVLIGELYVGPEHRGAGVGSRLLASVEGAARELGFRRLLAGALDGVEPFYVRNGFSPLLFLQIEGRDGGEVLDGLLGGELSGLEVTWKDYGERWSKAILRMNRVDKGLQESIDRQSAYIHVGYLITKEL